MYDTNNEKQKLSLSGASSEPIIPAESLYCHARFSSDMTVPVFWILSSGCFLLNPLLYQLINMGENFGDV